MSRAIAVFAAAVFMTVLIFAAGLVYTDAYAPQDSGEALVLSIDESVDTEMQPQLLAVYTSAGAK